MVRNKWFVIILTAVIILGLGAGVAQALPPAQSGAAAGVTIPYAGRLTDEAGLAVPDGDYAFTFALYDAVTGGTPLWFETLERVAVVDGGFAVVLGRQTPIPAEVLTTDRWLEVAVRGLMSDGFAPLSPRQSVHAAATATDAAVDQAAPCAHDHWGESWGESAIGVAFPGPFVALYGHSDTYVGVMGQSGDNIAVYGTSTNATGVYGQSINGNGSFFETDSGNYLDGDVSLGGTVGSVVAYDAAGSELFLSARGDVTVHLDIDNDGTHNFNVKNGLDFTVCWIDETGLLTCTAPKSTAVDTEEYGWRQLYSVESPELWAEDLGTVALVNGEAVVAFEAIFAKTANLAAEYHVFVTPLSAEPVWLYVTAKDSSGFTVRGVTLDGQPADCSFDYRVMAKRLGYEGVRLAPFAPAEEER